MLHIDVATEDDLPEIEAYLSARAETSMFLRSNLRAAGLTWTGARQQGQYVVGKDGGALVGIAGQVWNGMILVQSDAHAGPLVAEAIRRSGRPVAGLSGPDDQVRAGRRALGLDDVPAGLDAREVLMALSLDGLVVPPALADGRVQVRRGHAGDRDLVSAWRLEYDIETIGAPRAPSTGNDAGRWFEAMVAGDSLWIAEADGAPVAMTAINARVPDCWQVGGVYTPPPLRGRGHARAAVAASLLDARAAGAGRAILFTPRADAAAAYRAIGFAPIGHYGLIIYSTPVPANLETPR